MFFNENARQVDTNSVESVLKTLAESRFVFHRTGSRALGIHQKDADYDFFATWNTEICSFLSRNGFRELNSAYSVYPEGDNIQELICVYRHERFPVDVQLVHEAKRKQEIQDWIAPLLVTYRREPKEIKKIIWQTAFTMYRSFGRAVIRGVKGLNDD